MHLKSYRLDLNDWHMQVYVSLQPNFFVTLQPNTQPPAQQACTLVLRKPKKSKKIQWSEETVDNENMGKKKSKCKFYVTGGRLAVACETYQ